MYRKLIISFGILFFMASPFSILYAQNTEVPENWSIIAEGEVIDEDYAAAAEVIRISGDVLGDVYVLGGQITIDGFVDGDVIAMGGVVRILGEVTQNVRAAGGEVLISGTIGRNVTVGGMNITFTRGADIKGGVVIGGANVFISSPIGKSVRIAGRNFTLSNSVQGDIEAAVENIGFTNDARVGGDFVYWSNAEAQIDQRAMVTGVIERKSPSQFTGPFSGPAEFIWRAIQPILGIFNLVTTLVLGLLLVRIFPGYTKEAVLSLQTTRWRTFVNGVTALFVIPIIGGLLILTIVGIPLGFFLLLAYAFLLYITRIFVMLFIGRLLAERFFPSWVHKGEWLLFVSGLIVYTIFAFIPIIGVIFSFVAVIFGLGAMIQALKEIYEKRKKAATA